MKFTLLMKSIVTVVLFVIPMLAVCQSKSSIDAMIGGHLTSRVMNFDYNEVSALNWSTGFHYNRKLSERSYFRTGIQLTAMGYKSEKTSEFQWGDQVNEEFEYDPSIPTMEPGDFSEIQFVHSRNFVGIPIALRYELNARKVIAFIEGGFTPSVFLYSRNKLITDSQTHSQDGSYPSQNDFHFVGHVSAGIQSTLSPGFQWFAQPIFRYHFTKTVDAPIKEHLYGVGVEIGVRKEML